jgi:hypothetical protein
MWNDALSKTCHQTSIIFRQIDFLKASSKTLQAITRMNYINCLSSYIFLIGISEISFLVANKKNRASKARLHPCCYE